MDQADLKDELIASFPPGTRDFLDFDDPAGPGPLMNSCAGVMKDRGFDQVEQLRLESNPATCVVVLSEWERSLGLSNTDPARSGDPEQRRAQVFARLREVGSTTIANIQSIVGPLLDYADPSQLVVLEVDRAVLRAAHTYAWSGSITIGTFPTPLQWRVLDTAKVSDSGAQVDLALNVSDLSRVGLILTGPDGTIQIAANPIGRGAYNGTIRMYFNDFMGKAVGGLWSLQIEMLGGTGTLSAANLFVEGFGRDGAGNDGLAAAKFFWGVVAEPHLMGPRANLAAAAAAVVRINYATRAGYLVLRSDESGLPFGDFDCIPDDPNTIPSECIPG